jgi:hypothetical protein
VDEMLLGERRAGEGGGGGGVQVDVHLEHIVRAIHDITQVIEAE